MPALLVAALTTWRAVEGVMIAGVANAVTAAADTSDCERVRSAFPHQPMATWSSAAFAIVGVVVALRFGRDRAGRLRDRVLAFAVLLVAAGLGSAAYHGSGGSTARWFHDVSFLLALGFVGADDWLPAGRWSPRRRSVAAIGALGLAVLPLWSSLTDPVLVGVSVFVGIAEIRAWRGRSPAARRDLVTAGCVLAVAAAVYLLSRTDGPWCDPDSVLQGHALWHVLVAVAFGLWARAAFTSSSQG